MKSLLTPHSRGIHKLTGVGLVKPGTAADLLVLDADPTVDIANLKRIRQVVLSGEFLDRASFLRRP